MTSTSGRSAVACRRHPVMASKMAKRAASDGREGAGGGAVVPRRSARSGASWASGSAPAPSQAARARSSRSSARTRIAWAHGQNGGAPPASQQRTQSTRAPRWLAAWSARCSASQVLPIPGSPATSSSRTLPPSASSRPAASSASSRSRPTNARPAPRRVGACFSSIAPTSLTRGPHTWNTPPRMHHRSAAMNARRTSG